MIRNALVVVAAIVLSGLLGSLAGFLSARDPDAQLFRDVFAERSAGNQIDEQRAAGLWAALERARFRHTWVYSPAVLLIVGVFVGMASRHRAWLLALIGAAPFAFFFSVSIEGFISGLPLLCAYLAIAAFAAWSTSLLVGRARTAAQS